jgi:hypothetical protein
MSAAAELFLLANLRQATSRPYPFFFAAINSSILISSVG